MVLILCLQNVNHKQNHLFRWRIFNYLKWLAIYCYLNLFMVILIHTIVTRPANSVHLPNHRMFSVRSNFRKENHSWHWPRFQQILVFENAINKVFFIGSLGTQLFQFIRAIYKHMVDLKSYLGHYGNSFMELRIHSRNKIVVNIFSKQKPNQNKQK